ncbi:TetR family transcriptional regulator [Allosaccharopolyspora coralli]|uniref:TetR family transcriptional regulator n=1 Tax=Allosaccharopolyspora coralli TaxID=2665642 RepID=A0A5Q3QB45_9PSEU|nr:TetR/AcrR family transcriptional regulator [Allosaccharopolyspora coralli]QGK68829.1 TetR family transcriptional regulator [Allosaccharopolyspora coralli]
MARPRTVTRVHQAVLAMVGEIGFARLTMEGIATRAQVSKQTLYRSWPSPAAILFDALLASSSAPNGEIQVPDTGQLANDLEALLLATVAEMNDAAHDTMLRAVTAEIQTDPALATDLRTRLLDPQLRAVAARLAEAGVQDPAAITELLYGPMFHRWLLRTGPLDTDWAQAHLQRVLKAIDWSTSSP